MPQIISPEESGKFSFSGKLALLKLNPVTLLSGKRGRVKAKPVEYEVSKRQVATSWQEVSTISSPVTHGERYRVSLQRTVRRLWHLIERTIPFLRVAISSKGIWSAEGRQLIWGKARRVFYSAIPPLARHLQKKYQLSGGCVSCGASCKLLFQCPHWDDKSHLCSVYEDRPNICRFFPITPSDIKDRNLVLKNIACGFTFTEPKQ